MVSSRYERSAHWVLLSSLASTALLASACGGKDAGDRELLAGAAGASGVVAVDVRSCDAPNQHTVEMIEPFEDETTATAFTFEGSQGTAYFWTTNDVCAICKQLQEEANGLSQLQDKEGSEVENPVTDEEVAAKWDEFYACDDHCQEVQDPPFSDESTLPTAALEEEHCGSARAMRIQSGPFTVWGGAIGASFSQGALDVRQWEGISFWARKGQDPDVGPTVFLAITEKHTTEKQKADPGYECGCTEGDDCDEAAEACDRFGVAVGLSEEWRYFAVPFARMRQRGYGAPAEYMDLAGLLGVAVYYEVGTWDFWIDDLGFYRAKDEE